MTRRQTPAACFEKILRTTYFLLVPLVLSRREEETFSTNSQESAPGQADSADGFGGAYRMDI